MRSTFTTTSALLASLLAKDALAGPAHALRHNKHNKKDVVIDYVTDDVVQTVWETVVVTVDPNAPVATPAPVTTSTSVAPVVVVSTPTSIASVSSAPASVYIPAPPASSSTPVPTTLVTAQVEAPVATSSSTTTSAAAVASSSSSGKRGLSYNDASLLSGFSGMEQISWAYNWASADAGLALSAVEYIPLLWGQASEFTSVWSANAQSAIDSGSTHLFFYNEPDLSTQANVGYAAAAADWTTYMEPFAGKASLVAPAVTNGGSPLGLTYLENFLSACTDCTIDKVNIHWYDSATNIDYFKNYVAEAYTSGGNRPVIISEFGCASGTDDEINTFLETVLPWLDEQDYVEKYAYFMASDGVLLSSGSTLSTLGETYATTT